MIAKPVSVKKAKKAAKQRAAAEANAARAEAFMAAKDGRAEAPKKRKAESDDEALAHDALEAAVRSGAAAAERKAAKKAKKAKKANLRDAEGDERRANDTTNTSSKSRESKDGVDDDDHLEADDGSRAEKIAAFIAEHQIDVPEGAPAPFLTFAEAPFPKRLTQALLKQGYESPSPIQAQAWPIALSGKDIVAVAKTGSGKTCGFLLPAVCRVVRDGACAAPEMEMVDGRFRPAAVTPSAIVLAPTRELAIQIGDECLKFCPAAGAKVVTLYGGASKGDQLRALRAGADVVVATPGRLNDFLAPPPGFSAPVRATHAKYVVLDEADRMLDMGFEPQLREVFAATPPPPGPEEEYSEDRERAGSTEIRIRRQTLLFSATWPKSVRKLAAGYLNQDKSRVQEIFIGEGAADGELAANKAISQRFIQARDHEKDEHLYNLICEFPDDSRVVIFANTKRRVENLAKTFAAEGFGTVSVHGDKSQADREASLRKFIENRAPLMMATDVAARGLDIKGVSHVVNYDMARDVESYVHRIGRTGRAGELGAAVTFWNVDYDKPCAPALCKIARDAGQAVPDWLTKFEKTKESKQWRVADAHM